MSTDPEREDRAFEALIVSHLLRERDLSNLDDLPELSESEMIAMNSVSSDIVEILWDNAEQENDSSEDEPICNHLNETTEEILSAAMNRAEEMDEETKQKLAKARKEVIDGIRMRSKGISNVNP